MSFSTLFSKKIILLFISIITLIVLGLIVSIIFINYRSTENSSYVKDLTDFTNKVNNTLNAKAKADDEYIALIERIDKAKNNKTDDGKYAYLVSTSDKLGLIYSLTNQSEIYGLINNDLASLAKKHFPKQYKEENFSYPCQDPKCAKDSQPQEILAIVEEIKNSDFRETYKTQYSQNLLNTGYETGDLDPVHIAWQYYRTGESIEKSDHISESGANKTIGNKIKEFVINKFPEEYKLIIKSKNAPSTSLEEPDPGPQNENI
jgi:hypothetical protein